MNYEENVKNETDEILEVSLEDKLERQVENGLNKMNNSDTGSEEYKATAELTLKCIDKLIDIQRTNNRLEQEIEKQEKEIELKERELIIKEEEIKEQKKDRKVKNVITVCGVVIPALITVKELNLSKKIALAAFEFEKEGTVTSLMGRQALMRFIPRRFK